ncbi:MAG: carboxylate-amine ligase [Gemmatimonadetes bacterium]|nr:carboxylate-amine ligase [Gemmatimonadota bacterium]
MIPHPPFASQLTLEDELRAFEALQPRLAHVWSHLAQESDQPSTTVVVPSLTLDPAGLERLEGAAYYEERLLFLLIRLRNPRARVVYVTSQPVHPLILDYLLQLLPGIPASHARQRLTMLCAHDASPRPLTQKILERPRLIERIRQAVGEPGQAFLSVFNATPLERRLAVLLGIPLNGVDPALAHLGSKSGSRKVFRSAGVPLPDGAEDLRDELDIVEALAALKARQPGLRRAMLKLDEGFSGEGNALFTYPAAGGAGALAPALEGLRFVAPGEDRAGFLAKFRAMGGVVEAFLEAREVQSPSAQLRTNPNGGVMLLSTHDQLLGGADAQIFEGCRFPAADGYRREVQELGLRVGRVLADLGVVSRFGVDFLATRDAPSSAWQLHAIEINLRLGGTTHPFLALRFLTGGELDPSSGLFRSPSGRPKYYRATDNLHSPRYRGLLPEDLLEITTINQLNFDHRRETGVLFHLIGALSQYGKLGLTAIGNSHAEADELYQRTLDILQYETRFG